MSFYSQYELLEPIPGGTARTFKARQLASGRFVMVHLLVGTAAVLDRQIDGLAAEKKALVLDRGSNDGTPYVVTSPLPAGMSFDEWVGPAVAAPEASAVPSPAAPPPPVAAPRVDVGTRVGKWDIDRKSTRLNSSHIPLSRMPSSA